MSRSPVKASKGVPHKYEYQMHTAATTTDSTYQSPTTTTAPQIPIQNTTITTTPPPCFDPDCTNCPYNQVCRNSKTNSKTLPNTTPYIPPYIAPYIHTTISI